MQLTRTDVQIIEKVVNTKNGVFLARFAVANIAGTFKWKLIEMVPMASEETLSNKVILLESPKTLQAVTFVEPIVQKIVSPFIELFFFTSQPTRAPNR